MISYFPLLQHYSFCSALIFLNDFTFNLSLNYFIKCRNGYAGRGEARKKDGSVQWTVLSVSILAAAELLRFAFRHVSALNWKVNECYFRMRFSSALSPSLHKQFSQAFAGKFGFWCNGNLRNRLRLCVFNNVDFLVTLMEHFADQNASSPTLQPINDMFVLL